MILRSVQWPSKCKAKDEDLLGGLVGPIEPLEHRAAANQLQPDVLPQVSHFRHVPLRTMVKLEHSEQLSPV